MKTPNLDRLASEGVRFTHAASSSPVCSPFRGTMQTGLYPHTHCVSRNNVLLNPELTGIAQVFASAGYVPPDRRMGWQEWHAHEKGHSFFDVWTFDDQGNKVHHEAYDLEPT